MSHDVCNGHVSTKDFDDMKRTIIELSKRLDAVEQRGQTKGPHSDVTLIGGEWASTFFIRYPMPYQMTDREFAEMLRGCLKTPFYFMTVVQSHVEFGSKLISIAEVYVCTIDYCSLNDLSHEIYNLSTDERMQDMPMIMISNLQCYQDALVIRHDLAQKQMQVYERDSYTYYTVDDDKIKENVGGIPELNEAFRSHGNSWLILVSKRPTIIDVL